MFRGRMHSASCFSTWSEKGHIANKSLTSWSYHHVFVGMGMGCPVKMHTTLGKHHLLFRWYGTSSWSSWSSCCWPLRCCRTCGRCTWSSLGRCRSSGPAGPPGLSQQRRLPAVIQQLNNWISSLVLLSFKTYNVQNNISLFHLKTEGKEGTIKESVHEEHLAWKRKHNV